MGRGSKDPALAQASKGDADGASRPGVARADDQRKNTDVAEEGDVRRPEPARSAMSHISFDLASAATLKLTLYADAIYASVIRPLVKGR